MWLSYTVKSDEVSQVHVLRALSISKRQLPRYLIMPLLYCNVLLFFLLLFAQSASAAEVTLAWDSNTEPDLAGYYVYYKTGSSGAPYDGTGANEGNSPIEVAVADLSDPDNPEYTLTGLSDSETYFFVVTAYDTDGDESGYSNEVSQPPSFLTLTSLTMSGDDSVNESNTASYTATATFSDDSTQTVTGSCDWSVDSPYASIDNGGAMTTSEVSSDEPVTVEVSYTHNEVTETVTKVVTIVDVPEGNQPPNTPVIFYPDDGERELEVPLYITAESFWDPDGHSHGQSRWQISERRDFSTLILDVTSNRHLTELQVPHSVLKSNQTYYVCVRFYDAFSEASDWSDSVEFTTGFVFDDFDSDGIADAWEVDDTVDFNLDGMPDNYQPEIIKCVRATVGSAYIGVEKLSDSITEIEALEVIDPATIYETANRPSDLIFGLFSYRLLLNQPGAVADLRIYFSGGIFQADTFYKYETINGWYDYSQHTTFNDDGQSITLKLKDGGYGDSDGVVNGVIADPGGVVSGSTLPFNGSGIDGVAVDSGVEGGGCFIATINKEWSHLKN